MTKPLVMITGACGGLGKAFCVECASRGWDLFITDVSTGYLDDLSSGLKSAWGINVFSYACDLTDVASRDALFGSIRSSGMKFHMLINVAGVEFEGLFMEKTREQLRTLLRVNIEGTLEVTREMIARRDPAQPFRIITVSSLAAFYPMPVKAMYAASKVFLLNFFRALREELRHRGCTITLLCPAGMPTNKMLMESIDSQGFMGLLTTRNTGYVANKTVNHALKGKHTYIPGIVNVFLRILGGLLPPRVVSKAIAARWRTVAKRLPQPVEEPSSGLALDA
ncbi:MAG: SDR family NAD(P)-dependent oxidoreductase [Bacillota bacterium]|nr:SDR family NAD(P)-dependent oxidoreductase [Bacillota bacterium]